MVESELATETKKLVSDFNEAKFQILRLNSIWNNCNYNSITGNFDKWNWYLDRAFVELTIDMDDEDKGKDSDKEDSYFQKVKKVNDKINGKDVSKKEMYQLLMQKEQTLRRLQNAAGKGSRKSGLDENLMD